MSPGKYLSLLSAAGIAIAVVAAQSPDTPDWQAAVGGKLSFEVASVKLGTRPRLPDFPLDNGNAKTPGVRFSTNFPLFAYIAFAYKLPPNEEQRRAMLAQLPKWAGGFFGAGEVFPPNCEIQQSMREKKRRPSGGLAEYHYGVARPGHVHFRIPGRGGG
jgi:hypothetical protein